MTGLSDVLSPVVVAVALGVSNIVLAILLYRQRGVASQVRGQVEKEKWVLQQEASAAAKNAQDVVTKHITTLQEECERVRQHYASASRAQYEELSVELQKARAEAQALAPYADRAAAEEDARARIAEAIRVAAGLRAEAEAMVARAHLEAERQTTEGERDANEILKHATQESARLLHVATAQAEKIGGDAYQAMQEKDLLKRALTAIKNDIEGYGDRYIVPTRSILDDLASDYGHTQTGQALHLAREQTKRMVADREAAECDYKEADRRETAIRFVIDAFNGKVDGILSRTRHDNVGTLEQEIRDAFEQVNHHGAAFRNARILPTYLEMRLAELKWGVAGQELRKKEKEEQRRIKEQIREEEKARRDYERAMREAEEQEVVIKRAMEKARAEAEHATASQRAKYEAELAQLSEQLAAAEARNQRALSMAQQTRAGHVYVISNVGSFGEHVVKIGMTRRLEPGDRIKELGDASVPFEFDVHAMIYSDDAPTLEAMLHAEFDDARINRVNARKEFFRVPLERVRSLVAERKLEASFTILAEAQEWRESQALARPTIDGANPSST